MIGSFGEVYLVDWGIAVSTRDDPTGRFPSVKDAKEIAGTPAYMAPEMLGALGTLDDRTDVYLLGAILHEILTGVPPHQGTFAQIVSSILLSEPKYGADVPRELAAIAQRAMARAQEGRFASVEELKQRLEWYLRHRGSLALSREAEKSLGALRGLVEAGKLDEVARNRIYHLFAEARFGFRQAIAASADNVDARSGLRSAIEAVVAFELAAGTAQAASSALAELEDPPAALLERVADASARAKAERAALEKIRAEHDPQTGRRTRLAVGVIAGACWTIVPLSGPWFERNVVDTTNPHAARVMFGWTIACLGVGAALGRWGRESLSKTIVNRRLRALTMLNFAGQLLIELACELVGVPWTPMMVLHFVVWFLSTSGLALVVDARLWPVPLIYLAGLVAASLEPSYFWYICSLSQLGLVVSFLIAWGRIDDTRPGRHLVQQVRRRPR
jgi:serine/threonine-protein kinase